MKYDIKYWNYKSVRDPLYGFIHLSERETFLVGTPFMHRLTRIKQLAHTYLVYPSAIHSRFEHSLGVLHMADRLCLCFKIDGERREVIRCASLLHDVGHGPFSHIFENIMVKINGGKFTHEDVTKAIIEQDDDIRAILEGNFGGNKKTVSDIHSKVLGMFKKETQERAEENDPLDKSILSGTIDADKLDYLRRDSYHTGSTYGIFDLERMLSTLTTVDDNGKKYPAILEKGMPVLESFRLARYLLYTQVYRHHARLIADKMFLKALESAIFNERKVSKNLFKIYGREKSFINNFLNLDDSSVYDLVLSCRKNTADSVAFAIMNDLKNRRLFKRSYMREFSEIPPPKRMVLWKKDENILEREIADAANVKPEVVIAHKESGEGGLAAFRTFGRVTEAGEIPIMYIDQNGSPQVSEDRSPFGLRTEPSQLLYIFTKRDYREKVSAVCKRELC